MKFQGSDSAGFIHPYDNNRIAGSSRYSEFTNKVNIKYTSVLYGDQDVLSLILASAVGFFSRGELFHSMQKSKTSTVWLWKHDIFL